MTFYNVKILETNLEREYFTKRGLHLNLSGKECIALRLATVFNNNNNNNKSERYIYISYMLTVEKRHYDP